MDVSGNGIERTVGFINAAFNKTFGPSFVNAISNDCKLIGGNYEGLGAVSISGTVDKKMRSESFFFYLHQEGFANN